MMMSTYSLGMAWSGSGTQRILLMVAIGEWSVHDDDHHHHHYEDDFDDYGVDLSIINIATGETSQAITPFHFLDNSYFHHSITFITR